MLKKSLHTSTDFSTSRAALVVAHPGHEMCVYGWLETARPQVFILTDGSGRSGTSRLDSTTKILAEIGAQPGSIYGHFPDSTFYKAILDGDFRFFEQLVTELAEAMVEAEFDYVVGDGMEGYSPVHDVCRIVIDAAVQLAGHLGGGSIVNREFLLFARYNAQSETPADAIVLTLDDAALARKLAVARAYPELRSEVDSMLDKTVLDGLKQFPELLAHFSHIVTDNMGNEAYRVEGLRLASRPDWANGTTGEVPFYEHYGERLVESGVYDRSIRHRDHILPLTEAIRSFVDQTAAARMTHAAGKP
jgi:AcrR family transcriptional regulator